MGKLYEIGANGMREISVKDGDKKNDLPIGTILQLQGYSCPSYVVVKKGGVDEKYPHYGARYTAVNLTDFSITIEDVHCLKDIKEKGNNGIQMYYTDEIMPAAEVLEVWQKAQKVEAEKQEHPTKAAELAEQQEAKGRELFKKYIPAEAKALIVATLETDDCDMQTDYFNVTHSGLTILGWSKHTRDIFSEMRKHAHKIPETEHLATGGEKDEHREKYSRGSGYYLKSGNHYSTGWAVSKQKKFREEWDRDLYIAMGERCIFEETPEAVPEAVPAAPEATPEIIDVIPEPRAEETTIPAEQAEQKADKLPIEIGDYKGHATIRLPMNGKGFCFGLSKAKAIVEYIDEIREFIDAEGK